ncbi:MAG TPA: asparagine synthase (glutamine-hydrolyzing) [Candidatus Binatia bacterium]|nr:asparagine synthase (glutamine-hydrolyzing) [Candidatus Binatia bacterium]
MCGIFGGTPELISRDAERLLHHRGPDQQGRVVVHAQDGAPLMIGQTRLNVVCKADVPTPMQRDGATIAFNGEIYNWRPLRRELEEKGWAFATPTDTEVVLCAYLEWGVECLERFNGMFAIAIWHDGRLFLARDRMGKKPLFYTHGPRGLGFASELKCFRNLDFAEVPICRALEFYFDEHTPFRNVRSVRPGEYLLYAPATNALGARRWWSFPAPVIEYAEEDAARATEDFLALFTDACRLRMVADVPVTIFLSGGTDSSLIQAVLGCDVSYTVQFAEFEETINERQYVVEYARRRGFEPRIVTPTREDFLETFPDLARCIEFPVGSQSVLPLYCLARRARQDGFVVALSGEGADELFNGYYRNELLLREAESIAVDFDGPYGTLCRRYFGTPVERFCRMASRQGLAGVPFLLEWFEPRWSEERTFAQNLAFLESTVFLQPLLVMADRLSMGNSLEVRNPFLDHRIVEFSTRIADGLKFRDGQGKWLLRRALRELVGPDLGIVTRRIKHGLPAPVNQWLFKSSAFDRKDWNALLFGECLKQLARAHDPE